MIKYYIVESRRKKKNTEAEIGAKNLFKKCCRINLWKSFITKKGNVTLKNVPLILGELSSHFSKCLNITMACVKGAGQGEWKRVCLPKPYLSTKVVEDSHYTHRNQLVHTASQSFSSKGKHKRNFLFPGHGYNIIESLIQSTWESQYIQRF